MHARSLTRRRLLGALGASALALASASFVSNTPAAPRQDVEAGRPDLPPDDPPPDPPADRSAGPSQAPTAVALPGRPVRIGSLDGGPEAARVAQQLHASLARAVPGRAVEYGAAGQGIRAAPQVPAGAGEPRAGPARLRLPRHPGPGAP